MEKHLTYIYENSAIRYNCQINSSYFSDAIINLLPLFRKTLKT